MGDSAKGQKEMTRVVVCDTGPLLHLNEIGAIDLLSLAGEVFIPLIVANEFEKNTQGWKPPQWVQVVELDVTTKAKAEKWVKSNQVDAGEAEAIAFALQCKANWFLTDDAKARQLAEYLKLEVHGSIGLLLWAIAVGHVQEKSLAHQLLTNLANSSLWVSSQVLKSAKTAIDELFA